MIKAFFKKIKQNSFFRIYAAVIFPIIILIVFFCIVSFLSVKNYKTTITKAYSYSLSSLFRENNLNTEKIIQTIPHLSKDLSVINLASGNPCSTSEISAAIESLRVVKKNNPYIDNIAIFNRENDLIFSTNGNSEAKKFFYVEFMYDKYDYSYWKNFQSPVLEYQILPPTTVTEYSKRKNIIPIVFSRIGDYQLSNLIIINLNIDYILSDIQNEALTPNSVFLFINKKDELYFSVSGKETSIDNIDFFQHIIFDKHSVFDVNSLGKQKNLVIAYSPSASLTEYCFAAVIPYTDIHTQTKSFRTMIYILIALAFFLTLIIAYFSTKHVYAPFEKIATLFTTQKKDTYSDTIQYIYSSVVDTINSNHQLKETYSTTLPFSDERFIISLLNSELPFEENDVLTEKLSKIFEYPYFSSVIFKILPTEHFSENYSILDFGSIQSRLYNVIRILFDEKYRTYVIPSETDVLYLLLNIPSDDIENDIKNLINEFDKLVENDKSDINIYKGNGGIYPGLTGLIESHTNAKAKIPASDNTSNIQVNISKGRNNENYLLRNSDENNIFNLLITGSVEQANILIQNIFDEKKSKGLSEHSISQLSAQLLVVLFRVMRTKNLNYDVENIGDTALIQNIIAQPYDACINTIFEFTKQINSHMDNISLRVDIKEIIKYMQENYTLDLSREHVASIYHVSPKHLSDLLKQEVGMNFTDYLAYIRIEKAKILIKTTKKSITEIYENTGFNNRTTFIRTFKKETGLTPSEFKKSFS